MAFKPPIAPEPALIIVRQSARHPGMGMSCEILLRCLMTASVANAPSTTSRNLPERAEKPSRPESAITVLTPATRKRMIQLPTPY